MRLIKRLLTIMNREVIPIYTNESLRSQEEKIIDQSAVELAVNLLRKSSVIAVPTDTIYGLACCASSKEAVAKLYQIKKRNLVKPLAICVANVDDVYKWCNVNVPSSLLSQLLPGQVTLVFERSINLNSSINPDHSSIGVRIPGCQFIRSVSQKLGQPLALTSANVSNEEASLKVEEFSKLWPHLQGVFDAGSLASLDPHRLGSTIVDFSQTGRYSILRRGCAESLVSQVLSQHHLLPM